MQREVLPTAPRRKAQVGVVTILAGERGMMALEDSDPQCWEEDRRAHQQGDERAAGFILQIFHGKKNMVSTAWLKSG